MNEFDPTETAGGAEARYLQPWVRHLVMTVLSLVVIVIILAFSYYEGPQLFEPPELTPQPTPGKKYLLPYVTNLAGILLFILSTARRKREFWRLRDYFGDHVFRIAQSFAYLFVVLWAWPEAGARVAVSVRLYPNIIGFFVGLYILRVERAMEGLGDGFESILMSVLPSSVRSVSAAERRQRQAQAVYRLGELETQWLALRAQVDDPGARDSMDQLLARARAAEEDDDHGRARALVQEASLAFEELKRRAGEVVMSVDQLLGRPPEQQ